MASKSSPLINKVDRAVESQAKPTYMILITALYIIYVFIFLGISYVAPQYIRFISNTIHVLLASILMIKFNPFRANHTLAPTDGPLIFGAAVFILVNIGITEFAMSFFDSVKDVFNIDMTTIA
jgi:hypothetical protein